MKYSVVFMFLAAALLQIPAICSDAMMQIRKTPVVPFTAKGAADPAVWARYADRIGRLVNPKNTGAEFSPTSAQMLYDDTNLYISLRAGFKPEFRSDRTVKRSLFADNNFEIFLKADHSNQYYQIAVSESGLLFTAAGRTAQALPGIRKYVFSEKSCWRANLVIPLKSIGFSAKEQKIRFNICRYNIDMPKECEQQSSFAVMAGTPNYHVPDLWSTAVMTAAPGKPGVVWPHSDTARVNLMADPGFDFVTRPIRNPDIQRGETMILSRIWVIRATGKAYHFWSAAPGIPMKSGKEYTLKIRARRLGGEGALGCLQILRDGKRFREGPQPFWGVALTPDFQEYYFPFKAAENFHAFAFYRLGTKGKETGVEVENISLFEGRISQLEIRNVSRSGVKNIVPGTGICLPDNPYGKAEKPMTVLVIGRRLLNLADASELFTGLNVSADQLAVTDKNSDTYYTTGNPKTVTSRLENGQYDLYMVGGNGTGERIGSRLSEQIGKNVKKGAGLFWNVAGGRGKFATLLNASGLKNVGPDHLLKQALPMEFLVCQPARGTWSNDPLDGLQEGRYGNGKVVIGKTFFNGPDSDLMFQMLPAFSAMAADKFPWHDFNKAWLARLAYYTAGKLNAFISDIKINGDLVSVNSRNLKEGMALNWIVTDKNGGIAANGKTAIRNNQAEIRLPDLSMSGNYVFSVHALSSAGKTLDYSAKTFSRKGPYIISAKDRKRYHRGSDQAEIEIAVDGCKKGMKLEWALEDFSGRILERGTSDASKNTVLKIPLAALFTNLGNVEVRLKDQQKVRDVKRLAIVAQDRDRKRLLEDFTPAVWNHGPVSPGFSKETDRQLENIGIRSYVLAFHGLASLKNGMGTGFGWVNAKVFYSGSGKEKNHIRTVQFNTPESRKQIVQSARSKAENFKHLGVVHALICDEIGMTGLAASAEVDEHPDNLAEYRKRMKAKYGTIEEFNRRMGTTYTSFGQLKAGRIADARKSGKYGEFIEWRNFNEDRWAEAIKLASDATREGDPEVRFSGANSQGESPLNGINYWKMSMKTGIDFSHEYTYMVYQNNNPINNCAEIYRSFRPDMRLWGYTGYFFDRAKAFFQPWWYAAHRYGGFTWFGTYTCLGSGGGYYNLLDYTGACTQDAANLEAGLRKSNLLNGIGKLFLAYQWAKNDVAIYYSHNSLKLAFIRGREIRNRQILDGSPLWKFFHSRVNSAYVLEELLYQYDFLAPEQICAGKLNGRKAILMPGISAMSDAEVKAVKAFIAKGGRAIADFMPGEYDELGKKRGKAPFTDKEITLLGSIFNNKDAAQKQRVFDELNKAGSKPLVSVPDAAKIPGREAMHFVHGNMHIFVILRDQTKSKDSLTQTFTFPVKGHLYDVRAGKYLGFGSHVTAAVANGDAGVWGVYPYKADSIRIEAPGTMRGCQDFVAGLQIKVSNGKPGRHIIHAELIPPKGKARFFLKRNLLADNGKAEFRIRVAENDPDGIWTMKATDVLTGTSAEKKIVKK